MAAQESYGESYNSGCRELDSELRPLRMDSCCRVQTARRPLNPVDAGAPASGWASRGGGTESGRKFTCRLKRTCGAQLCGAAPRLRPHPGEGGQPVTLASLQIYPDESHYFHSERLRQHLYRAIVTFFAECFRVQDKPPAAPAKEEEEEED